MGFPMALNEKPRRRAGLDGPGDMALRFQCYLSVMEILTDCSSHVNHPTTFDARYWEYSLKPVGEERGAILKSVQRPPIYGHAAHSWEAWRRTGKPVKVANNGWLRQSSIRASGLGLVTPSHRTDSPSVIKGKYMDIPGLDHEAFDRWVAYRKAIKKPYKDVSLHAAAVKLAKYNDKQAEVVEQSIANQWQGLFDLQVKKLAPGEKPKKTKEQVAADDAYWQATVQRAEKGWNELIPTPLGRLKVCDALWARYTIEAGPDTPEKLDWLKGVVARNLREAEAKDVLNEPHLLVMVMCFFGPAGVKRIRERAGAGA